MITRTFLAIPVCLLCIIPTALSAGIVLPKPVPRPVEPEFGGGGNRGDPANNPEGGDVPGQRGGGGVPDGGGEGGNPWDINKPPEPTAVMDNKSAVKTISKILDQLSSVLDAANSVANPSTSTPSAILTLLPTATPQAETSQTNSTISHPPSKTAPIPTSAAQLGCSLYSAYQSYCQHSTPAYTSCFHIGQCSVHSASSSALDPQAFASCACYSSEFWVPAPYDSAVWACNQISTVDNGFTAAATSTGGSTVATGFCAGNNPRSAVFAAGVVVAAETPSPIATGYVASQTVPPTSGAASLALAGDRGVWMTRGRLVGAATIVIALLQME